MANGEARAVKTGNKNTPQYCTIIIIIVLYRMISKLNKRNLSNHIKLAHKELITITGNNYKVIIILIKEIIVKKISSLHLRIYT